MLAVTRSYILPTLHVCEHSGYLLGPDRYIPDDPAEFYRGKERILIGCTRMKCAVCKQLVQVERNLPEGQDFRTYQCGCSWTHRQGPGSRTVDYEDKDTYESALPWACAGHPITVLPFDLDGVRIARDTDFAALVRRTLGGWSPESARPGERASPVGWMIKLYVRLVDTGVEDAVSRAAATCIGDPDPRVRAAALSFFAVCPEAAGAECVENHVASDRSLFAGVPDPTGKGSDTIEEWLLRALAGRVLARASKRRVKAQRALKLARAEVLAPGKGDVLLSCLSTVDVNWLVKNAEAIAGAEPTRWYWLLITLPTSRVREVAVRLARVSGAHHERLRRFANSHAVHEEDRAAILKAIDAYDAKVARKAATKKATGKKPTPKK